MTTLSIDSSAPAPGNAYCTQIRGRHRRNIDVIRAWLEKHNTMTVSAFFLYALSPFPSNYLFIAYGLSGLPLRLIGVAFFIGRTVSYTGRSLALSRTKCRQ